MTNNDVDGTAGTANPGNGGALHVTGIVTTTISGGIVSGNDAAREGGGLWNQTGSTMTINNLTIDNNSASGAGATFGGGGIFVNGGNVFVNSSTISNNITDGVSGNGGGIHVKTGSATITTSTISGNTSATKGGGVYTNASLTINASTIANNTAATNGGGISNESATLPSLKNTIVATNFGLSDADISSSTGVFTSNGYNLIGKANGTNFTAGTGDLVGSDVSPLNPLFGSLANNGGLTFTHALAIGSPAYNTGDIADNFIDQAGNTVFGGRRDIGSLESQTQLSNASFTGKITSIYPNPASNGYVTIQLGNSFTTTNGSIYEIGSGKLVRQFDINASESQIALDNLATGVYIIKLTADGLNENHKLIID